MKPLKETETEGATPEQLLQILERELAFKRSHRPSSSRNRAMILVAGIILIVVAAGGALLLLNEMVADMRQSGPAPQAAPERLPTNY